MFCHKKYQNLTVIELKEKIKNLGGQGHSKYNKEELIFILHNLTNQLNINSVINPSNFLTEKSIFNIHHPGYHLDNNSWKKELMDNLWTVISIPNFDPNFYKNSILQKIQAFHQKSLISIFNNHSNFTNNTYNLHFLSHDILICQLRNHCKPIFEKIWKNNDLLCSFESPFILNTTHQNNYILETNQNHDIDDFISVEGLILFDNHSESGLILQPQNFNNQLFKITTSPINIIIFDSRLKRKIFNSINKYTLGVKISMQPEFGASQEELFLRKQYQDNKLSTTNWCYGPLFNKV
jgi:hypothetical protein